MKFFLPYMNIVGVEIPRPLHAIRAAGFDGVEIHLIGRMQVPSVVRRTISRAKSLGLEVRFHQGWGWHTGQKNAANAALWLSGSLVPPSASLSEQLTAVCQYPTVLYGNLLGDSVVPNALFQTMSLLSGGRFSGNFEHFLAKVKETNASVVFDTQHVLEWSLGSPDIVGLPRTTSRLRSLISTQWNNFRLYAKEIHLCDYNPTKGKLGGRNLSLGRGIFPLADFAGMVRDSDWQGIITPEILPQYLLFPQSLHNLRKKLDELFHQ